MLIKAFFCKKKKKKKAAIFIKVCFTFYIILKFEFNSNENRVSYLTGRSWYGGKLLHWGEEAIKN